jgi:riboflavin kinase / FMN adenylyltransferase
MSDVPVRISGVVIKGEGRAKELGAPTLNIPLTDSSLSGIYAARVEMKGKTYGAAVFADPSRGVLEAHLLDFDPQKSGDTTGAEITVELLAKLRDSEMFQSDDALRAAIAKDIIAAHAFFKHDGDN